MLGTCLVCLYFVAFAGCFAVGFVGWALWVDLLAFCVCVLDCVCACCFWFNCGVDLVRASGIAFAVADCCLITCVVGCYYDFGFVGFVVWFAGVCF